MIIDKKSGAVAGISQYGAVDFSQKRIEIGWTWLGEKWQGTGINYVAKHLMQKLGATCEGLLRNYSIQSYGPSKGYYVYSIIEEEWQSISESLIQTYGILD
ncbi:GNAT family N-acetyltransferase [Sphingobacterium suaedae]|uniref:GNAT family N-acetyltransferase n=1 Tax=Sphingobacterium suaedae TaxID=1686402 RepID=UPI0036D41817